MTGNRRDIRFAERQAPLVPSRQVDDEPTASDRLAVAHLLGREPQGDYRVVVRNSVTGWPVVIRNAPLLADGTPILLDFGAARQTIENAGVGFTGSKI